MEKELLISAVVDYLKQKTISPEQAGILLKKIMGEIAQYYTRDLPGSFVMKRDGRMQQFDDRKLKYSMANASDNAKQPMNEGDLNNVLRMVKKSISDMGQKVILSKDLRILVLETLMKQGFSKVADAYRIYTKYDERH